MPRKPHKYHYLYKTTNLINNKFYVGMHSTSNMEDGYLGSGKYLKRSIKKYGKENFKIEYLEFFSTREILVEEEMKLVDKDFIKDPFCMNLRVGGKGAATGHTFNLGSKRTEEQKKKMSAIQKGKSYEEKLGVEKAKKVKQKMSDDRKGINYIDRFGEERAAELKKKLSQICLEREFTHTTESKQKMSDSKKGKSRLDLLGKPLSEETKMKISKANKGKHSGHVPWNKGKTGIHSPETIEKMTKHLKGNTFKKGKKCSEESKLKMRIAHLGKQPKTIATRPVEQYDMNGVFIAKYSSVSEAVKQSGCSRSRITGVCRGNRPHTKNFIWKYATDSIVITNNPNVK